MTGTSIRRWTVPVGAAWAWALLVGVALAATGCGGGARDEAQPSYPVVREEQAGVELVTSTGPDRVLEWTFNPRFYLHRRGEEATTFAELTPGMIGTELRGRIYVLDRESRQVEVFHTDGGRLFSLGRPGSGLGEFEDGRALGVNPNSTVVVFEGARSSFVRWSPLGAVQPEIPLPGGMGGSGVAMAPAGIVLISNYMTLEEDTQRLLAVEGADTVVIAEAPAPGARRADLAGCGPFLRFGSVFERDMVWQHAWYTLAVVPGPAYSVDVYTNLVKVRTLRREIEPQEATAFLAALEVGDDPEIYGPGGGCLASPEEVVEALGFAPLIPVIAGVAVAPDGSIWVTRDEVGEGVGPTDVFSPEGVYLGTLPEGSPTPAAFLVDGDFMAIEEDGAGRYRVAVYGIVRGD